MKQKVVLEFILQIANSQSVNGCVLDSSNAIRDGCCIIFGRPEPHRSRSSTTSKNKIMTIAAILPGVENVSIEVEKNLLTVMGEEIDAVALVKTLRKKVGFSTIVSVGPESRAS